MSQSVRSRTGGRLRSRWCSGGPDQLVVELSGASGDSLPAEVLDDPPAAGLAEPAGLPGVGQQVVDPVGQVGGEAVGVAG